MAEIWHIPDDREMEPSGLTDFDVQPGPYCASCRQCCLGYPGHFLPADLGPTVEARRARARQLIESGLYTVDVLTDGKAVTFTLRPAMLGRTGVIFDQSNGGACALLGPAGCRLDRADRPTVCKALRPMMRPGGECPGLTRFDIVDAWLDDSDWLRELGGEIERERGLV